MVILEWEWQLDMREVGYRRCALSKGDYHFYIWQPATCQLEETMREWPIAKTRPAKASGSRGRAWLASRHPVRRVGRVAHMTEFISRLASLCGSVAVGVAEL